jgi:hypothetical protein
VRVAGDQNIHIQACEIKRSAPCVEKKKKMLNIAYSLSPNCFCF